MSHESGCRLVENVNRDKMQGQNTIPKARCDRDQAAAGAAHLFVRNRRLDG